MKKYILIILTLFLFIPCVNAKEVVVYFFHSNSCPHCRNEKEYLNTIDDENVKIKMYEISRYGNLMNKVITKLGIDDTSVPITIVGSDYIVGFRSELESEIDNLIDSYKDTKYCDVVDLILDNKNKDKIENCIKSNEGILKQKEEKSINIFGKKIEFNAKKVSLPLISILIGFVDGFNPCATWILIFLITMLFNMKDRRKMWILGLTFLITSGIVYFIFMLGLLTITNNLISTWFKYILALVAIIGGIINLKSFTNDLKKDVGCKVTNKEKRIRIIDRIKKIVQEKKFIISIIGIIMLAISVNFVELLCTSGLPTIFTSVLSLNNLTNYEYMMYMFIYIIMFMIDDIVIFVLAMKTFKITGISNKYTKYSHLVGGILMLLIGILMIFKIEWLMFNF